MYEKPKFKELFKKKYDLTEPLLPKTVGPEETLLSSRKSSKQPKKGDEIEPSIPRTSRDENLASLVEEKPGNSKRTLWHKSTTGSSDRRLSISTAPSGSSAPLKKYEHPLSHDSHKISITLFNSTEYEKYKAIPVEDLLLEKTEEARQFMKTYQLNRPHAKADVMLFKSILATAELQQKGVLYRRERGDNRFHQEEWLFRWKNDGTSYSSA